MKQRIHTTATMPNNSPANLIVSPSSKSAQVSSSSNFVTLMYKKSSADGTALNSAV